MDFHTFDPQTEEPVVLHTLEEIFDPRKNYFLSKKRDGKKLKETIQKMVGLNFDKQVRKGFAAELVFFTNNRSPFQSSDSAKKFLKELKKHNLEYLLFFKTFQFCEEARTHSLSLEDLVQKLRETDSKFLYRKRSYYSLQTIGSRIVFGEMQIILDILIRILLKKVSYYKKNVSTTRGFLYGKDYFELPSTGDYQIFVEKQLDDNGNVTSITKLEYAMELNYQNRSELYGRYSYSTDITKIVGERQWSNPKEGKPNLFGVELEISTDYADSAIIDAFPDIFCIMKDDSSITGSKRYKGELVTIPATLKKHRRMWVAFFKNTNIDMFDTSLYTNNGMHIHISRESFQEDNFHLKKFCAFFADVKNRDFLKKLSERENQKDIDNYCKFPAAGKIYQNDTSFTRLGKHSCINLGKSNTVEVRLFKGVVSLAAILKNLEFTDALIEFSRNSPFSSMISNHFLDWLSKLPHSSYRWLRMCLDSMKEKQKTNLFDEIREAITQSEGNKESALKALNKLNLTEEKDKLFAVIHFNHCFDPVNIEWSSSGKFVFSKEGSRFIDNDSKILSSYRF